MRTNASLHLGMVGVLGVLLVLGIPRVSAINSSNNTTVVLHPESQGSDLEIQAALDQLPAGGGTVVLAAGSYVIHHPLRLHRSSQTLRGSGTATVLRLADRADCPVVILGSTARDTAAAGLHDVCLADLVIDGNRSHQSQEQWANPLNTSGIQNNGVMIQNVSDSTVTDVVAAHCRSGGLVTANGTRRLTVNGFTAFDNQFDGLACYRTEESVFTRLNLHDNLAAGISLDWNFDHNVVSDSTLTGNDLGIFMRRSCDNQFRNVTIAQSRHDGVFMAQWEWRAPNGWQPQPQTECVGNSFDNLEIHDCAGAAFRVHDAACVKNVIQDGVFSGNHNGGLVEADAHLVLMRD